MEGSYAALLLFSWQSYFHRHEELFHYQNFFRLEGFKEKLNSSFLLPKNYMLTNSMEILYAQKLENETENSQLHQSHA